MKTYAEEGFYSLYRKYQDGLAPNERALSFTRFQDCKPFYVRSERKVVSCICVHHRSFLLRVQALKNARAKLHRSKGATRQGNCAHNDA